MKLKTRICKRSSLKSAENEQERHKESSSYPLSCVDWSSNEEIYFVR